MVLLKVVGILKVQVLVATMNQNDYSLLEKMNIQSDVIMSNQCDRNEIEEFEYKGYKVKILSFAEKGVGLNRNNALMRADSDICIIADDDIVYVDDYVNIIKKNFEENPNADVIIFNLFESPQKRYVIKRKFKVHFFNFMRFGAPRIAFRTKSIKKHGIAFNLIFGGGTYFSAGEDTLFLYECLRKGLNIIAVPEFIATLTDSRPSTWFKGYTDKYFIDRGALFACMSRKWSKLLSFQYCLRHRKKFKHAKTFWEAYNLMKKGINEFKHY